MKLLNMLAAASLVLASQFANAGIIVIDSFEARQEALVAGPGQTVEGFALDYTILGGERDLILRNFSPSVRSGESELKVSFGELNFSAGSRVRAEFEIQWDGLDNSSDINVSGLGGVDFSQINMLSFVTAMIFSDSNGFFDVTFWSNKNGSYLSDTIMLSIPEITVPREAFFKSTELALTGVNFADIGAIRVRGNVPENGQGLGNRVTSYDLTIDEVVAKSVSVPEPAAATMFGLGLFALGLTAVRRRKAISALA